MISVQNVSKSFGPVQALDHVSFEIKRGEVVGFLGPNGAGKTTMMRIITGFFPPSEGTVLIDGFDLFKSKPELRKKIGYLAEHNPLYSDMTAKDFLFYVAKLKGVSWKGRKEAVQKVIDQCGIGSVTNRIIGKLSKGFQQRLGLAQTLIGEPELLILDEPTNGLDPAQISEIRKVIRDLGRDRTVILSTHILPEVQMTCQRVFILNQGRLIASDTPNNLEENLKRFTEFHVKLRGSWTDGDEFLKQVSGVLEVRLEQNGGAERQYRIRMKRGSEAQSQIARVIMESGFELLELKALEWSLEDIFLKLVTKENPLHETIEEHV